MYAFHHGLKCIMQVERGISKLHTVLKRVISCLRSAVCSACDVCVCDKETGDAFHRHADWSDITGSYNTADTVVKDRRTK